MGSLSVFHYLIMLAIVGGFMVAVASSFPKPYRRMFVWIYAMFAAPMVGAIVEALFGVRLVPDDMAYPLSLALFWYPIYRAFRARRANGTEEAKPRAVAYIGIPLLSFFCMFVVAGVLTSISIGNVFDSLSGGPSIAGRYRNSVGNSFEFVKDGTLIVGMVGEQAIWTWQELNDNRLKLTPGPNVLGPTAAVCTYVFAGKGGLSLRDCPYAMNLSRL